MAGQCLPLAIATRHRSPWHSAAGRAGRLGGGQLCVQATEEGPHWAPEAEDQFQSPCAVDRSRGQVHQLLHHGADAPTFGAITRRGISPERAVLPDPAQEVVGERGAGEDRRIRGELARGQTLDVQVGLELAALLLAAPMVGTEGDDGFLFGPQARPPAFNLDLGDQQARVVLVDGPLDHAYDPTHGVVVAVVGARLEDIEQGHALARARFSEVAVLPGIGEPVLGALLARVPLDQVLHRGALCVVLLVCRDHDDVTDGIVAPVEARQQPGRRQLPGALQRAQQEGLPS